MKKWIGLLFILLAGVFFYHQYDWAGPYDAILRRTPTESATIREKLNRWRYHTDVWFEIVPDALTTVFKRLGIGGWSETGVRACVEGCPYWTQKWTDGFYSIDLELEKLVLSPEETLKFEEPRFLDVEIWGRIRRELEDKGRIPRVGQRVRICGPLRIDRPYYVYTLQPDRGDEIEITGPCEVLEKGEEKAVRRATNLTCPQISQLSLFHQVALLDSLASEKPGNEVRSTIEKVVACVHPSVLDGLSTNGEVYEKIVSLAPLVKSKLNPLQQKTEREDHPIRNTITDLMQYWTH